MRKYPAPLKERTKEARSGDPRVSGPEAIVHGQEEARYVAVRCPVCGTADAALRSVRLDLPYFGEVVETIFLCAQCGFKHADTLIPRVGEPTVYSLQIESEEDMLVRAVKSSSATVEVRDLGLLWEPGPASLAEVTNVEGLLRHFEGAVESARVLFATAEVARKADELVAKLHEVIAGKRSVEITIKDPYGNSALIDPRGNARKAALSPEEARELATGEYILDLSPDGEATLRRSPT